MNEAKLSLDVDFSNKYLKAKKDIYEAIKSFNELMPLQREKLLWELIAEGIICSNYNLNNFQW